MITMPYKVIRYTPKRCLQTHINAYTSLCFNNKKKIAILFIVHTNTRGICNTVPKKMVIASFDSFECFIGDDYYNSTTIRDEANLFHTNHVADMIRSTRERI